jgi:uncharacterized protein (TIGR02145 family)
MKHTTRFFTIFLLIGFLISANGQESVKDYDGNVYKTAKAGNQTWMAENLKVTHYRNGDPIPNILDPLQWKTLTSGAYCDVNNKPENTTAFGRLYNWYTTVEERNICPKGWHVPCDAEWTAIVTILYGEKGTGGLLPASKAINESIFQLLPEPFRGYDGEFSHNGYGGGGWWSATGCTEVTAFYHNINYDTIGRQRMQGLKYYGYYIRCIKD